MEARRLVAITGDDHDSGAWPVRRAPARHRLQYVLITGSPASTLRWSIPLYGAGGVLRARSVGAPAGQLHGSGCTAGVGHGGAAGARLDVHRRCSRPRVSPGAALVAGFRPGMGYLPDHRFFWARRRRPGDDCFGAPRPVAPHHAEDHLPPRCWQLVEAAVKRPGPVSQQARRRGAESRRPNRPPLPPLRAARPLVINDDLGWRWNSVPTAPTCRLRRRRSRPGRPRALGTSRILGISAATEWSRAIATGAGADYVASGRFLDVPRMPRRHRAPLWNCLTAPGAVSDMPVAPSAASPSAMRRRSPPPGPTWSRWSFSTPWTGRVRRIPEPV